MKEDFPARISRITDSVDLWLAGLSNITILSPLSETQDICTLRHKQSSDCSLSQTQRVLKTLKPRTPPGRREKQPRNHTPKHCLYSLLRCKKKSQTFIYKNENQISLYKTASSTCIYNKNIEHYWYQFAISWLIGALTCQISCLSITSEKPISQIAPWNKAESRREYGWNSTAFLSPSVITFSILDFFSFKINVFKQVNKSGFPPLGGPWCAFHHHYHPDEKFITCKK